MFCWSISVNGTSLFESITKMLWKLRNRNVKYNEVISLGDDLYNRQNIHLVFDGVDTVAEVKFNDVVLGKTQNMFTQYTFDIKKYVKVR